MQIETNGANNIVIYIPHEGSEKTLPAMLGMFEKNAVFLQSTYYEHTVVTPKISINLGDSVVINSSQAFQITTSENVLNDGFVPYTPTVGISNKEEIEKKNEEIKKLRTEVAFLKDSNQLLQNKVELYESNEGARHD
jgi:hypothetical protein